MAEETKGGLIWDRQYWPTCGTLIDEKIPTDLNDLWEQFEEQASVFVAEALISDPPGIYLRPGVNFEIVCFVWTVGGDSLSVTEPLSEAIAEACEDYDAVRSQDQYDEVAGYLAGLEELEATIRDAKKRLGDLMAAYKAA